VTPILNLVDFSYFFLIIRRKFLSDKYSQRELNQLYENPALDIAYRYSYIFKTILISFFFITLFPLGGLISLVGILFSYLIEKVNFFYPLNFLTKNKIKIELIKNN
jgi:hypothetical protein